MRTAETPRQRALGRTMEVGDVDDAQAIAGAPLISELPGAVEHLEALQGRLGQRLPAVFLDYDGVLTPIVDDPDAATLDPGARRALTSLAAVVPLAVISGRDLADVRGHVQIDGIAYAGSHGFDIRLADGSAEQYGTGFLDDLQAAEQRLRAELGAIQGVRVERKGFAIAVHFRLAADGAAAVVQEAVTRAAAAQGDGRLKVTGGKDIFELRPAIAWDKGRAVRRLMEVMELDPERHAPLYIGDDLTDEDAFAVVNDGGVSIVVAGERDRHTVAQFRLADPTQVIRFLEHLRELVTSKHVR